MQRCILFISGFKMNNIATQHKFLVRFYAPTYKLHDAGVFALEFPFFSPIQRDRIKFFLVW